MDQGSCFQLFYVSQVLLAAVFCISGVACSCFMKGHACSCFYVLKVLFQLFYGSRVLLATVLWIKGVAFRCFMNKPSCLQLFYESRVLLAAVLWIKGVAFRCFMNQMCYLHQCLCIKVVVVFSCVNVLRVLLSAVVYMNQGCCLQLLFIWIKGVACSCCLYESRVLLAAVV